MGREFAAWTVVAMAACATGIATQAGADPGTCVVRVAMRDARDVMLLSQISGDCWSHQPDEQGRMDWRIERDKLGLLTDAGLSYEIFIADCEADAADEAARLAGPFEARDWFDDFKPWADVQSFGQQLATDHPDLVRRQTIGATIEGRELFAVRATSPAGGGFDGGKPVILFNGTQHAREWITVMASLYTFNKLVTEWSPSAVDRDILDKYEIILVPVVNADGYVYTWTQDRYWRTNRRRNANNTFGVDTNRNWGYQWGLNSGSSGTPGNETYRGTAPFSEPETQAMRDLSVGLGSRVAMYLDVHSYGLYILWPWGYSADPSPAAGLFNSWGPRMRTAMSVSGQTYRIGQGYTRLYPTSGASKDYMYGGRDALSWTLELTNTGFVAPPSAIRPSGEEVYACIKQIARDLCRADYNRDDFLDFFDYTAFTQAFEAGAPRADHNLDGFIDFFDYAAFIEEFQAGC